MAYHRQSFNATSLGFPEVPSHSFGVGIPRVSATPLEGVESPQNLHRLCETVLRLPSLVTPSEGVVFPRISATPLEGVGFSCISLPVPAGGSGFSLGTKKAVLRTVSKYGF